MDGRGVNKTLLDLGPDIFDVSTSQTGLVQLASHFDQVPRIAGKVNFTDDLDPITIYFRKEEFLCDDGLVVPGHRCTDRESSLLSLTGDGVQHKFFLSLGVGIAVCAASHLAKHWFHQLGVFKCGCHCFSF